MLKLNGAPLALETVEAVAENRLAVGLADDARVNMRASREVIEKIVAENRTVYGVNTGFGRLSDVSIPPGEIRDLQLNLVRSHACGVGRPLSISESRAMVLLRTNVLAKGLSGARMEVAEALLELLEKGVTPFIPEKGSVGASGDLAPLAHLALVTLGEGKAYFHGEEMSGVAALKAAGIQPIHLDAKEGLAMLNGTQAILAVGGLALMRAIHVSKTLDVAGAMSLEALMGTPVAFDRRIHEARPHEGQLQVAEHLRQLLHNSEIRDSHIEGDSRVQDAYCLRCMPQVHGATRDALAYARKTLECETGSATDNPLVFAQQGDVLSGGNFHGAPLAIALDFAAIALTHVAGICERRIDRLVNPDANEGLPAFLTDHPGNCSGFMIAQVTAAALTNECRVLAHPASSDNTPTSGGKEDHVSMGMTSALKFRQIVENLEYLVAIEMFAAAQGLECRKPLKPGQALQPTYDRVRELVEPLGVDRALSEDIERLALAIRERRLP